jgi:probable F420-dependent oxidoreductase
MDFGVATSTRGQASTREGYIALAETAERLGFGFISVNDHVIVPRGIASKYPYSEDHTWAGASAGECLDLLTTLAFLAGRSERLKLLSSVMVVPHRHPVLTAKMLATIDVLSRGRLIVGCGVGWLKEEFEAVGVPFEKRGARTDEYIAVMRKLWAEDGVSFAGQFVNCDEVSSNPKPVGNSVPIVIGGHSEAAARRAGRLGDGFFPSIGAQVDTVPLFDVVRSAAADAGRDPGDIEIMAGCPDLLPGSTKDPRAAIEARAKQGVSRIILPVWRYLPDLEDGLGRFGETVIRQFR